MDSNIKVCGEWLMTYKCVRSGEEIPLKRTKVYKGKGVQNKLIFLPSPDKQVQPSSFDLPFNYFQLANP